MAEAAARGCGGARSARRHDASPRSSRREPPLAAPAAPLLVRARRRAQRRASARRLPVLPRLCRRDRRRARPLRRPLAPRSPGDSPTALSRAPGSAKGRGAMPGSPPAAATGFSKSMPTSGSIAELAAEIRAVVASSPADWHLIPVDNYIGDRLVRWGWGASFGRSAHAGLFRRGAKRWGEGGVHPAIALSGSQGPTLGARAGALRRPQHLGHAAPARPLYQRAGAGSARQRRYRQLRA